MKTTTLSLLVSFVFLFPGAVTVKGYTPPPVDFDRVYDNVAIAFTYSCSGTPLVVDAEPTDFTVGVSVTGEYLLSVSNSSLAVDDNLYLIDIYYTTLHTICTENLPPLVIAVTVTTTEFYTDYHLQYNIRDETLVLISKDIVE